MNIGIIPDPEQHEDWEVLKGYLEPAAKLGDREVLLPNEMVWAVYDDGPVAAAVACIKVDGFGEIPLVGGRGHREWIHQLDWLIGSWMRREGMTSVRACGRKGWRRVLTNWTVTGSEGDLLIYERAV